MDMPNVQVQTPSNQSATSTNTSSAAVTSSTGGDASSSTFVQTLVKVIEGQGAGEQVEASTEAAASMIVAILPSAIANLISEQSAEGEINETIKQLIHNIQTMDSEKLQSLMEQPELQQLMIKVEQLLTEASGNSTKSAQVPNVSTLTVVPTELKSVQANELVVVLKRYLELLETNPNNPTAQQLGSELKLLTTKLSESFPALTAAPIAQIEANKLEVSKTDKPTITSTHSIQSAENKSSAHNSEGTLQQQEPKSSQSQLLQRLAYINHNVSHTVENQTVSEAPIMTVEASAAPQEEVALTTTQLSDGSKLTSTTSENKVTMQTVSAQEFAEEMSRFVVKNMSLTQFNGISEAKISLLPEHLGQVDVRISVLNGQITAHFIAESAHARDLLELQLPQLRASLQQQGLQVDKLNVEQQSHLGNSMFQDQRQQQSSQNFNQSSKRNGKDYDQFGTDFSAEMDHAVRVNRLAYGNTFNATA